MATRPSAALQAAVAGDTTQRPKEDTLETIRKTVKEMRKKQTEIEDLDRQRNILQTELLEYQQRKLPDLFVDAGIDTIGITDDGNQPPYDADLKPYYNAKIPEEREAEAAKWLEKHKFGDLLKTTISMSFGMGDRAIVKKVLAALKKLKVTVQVTDKIHSSTLKAFVKEQIEEENYTPPKDLFGITTGNVVVIKPRKESKAKRSKKE